MDSRIDANQPIPKPSSSGFDITRENAKKVEQQRTSTSKNEPSHFSENTEINFHLEQLSDQHKEIDPDSLEIKVKRINTAHNQIQDDGAAIANLPNKDAIEAKYISELQNLIDNARYHIKCFQHYENDKEQGSKAVDRLERTSDTFHKWKEYLVDGKGSSISIEIISHLERLNDQYEEIKPDQLKAQKPDSIYPTREERISTAITKIQDDGAEIAKLSNIDAKYLKHVKSLIDTSILNIRSFYMHKVYKEREISVSSKLEAVEALEKTSNLLKQWKRYLVDGEGPTPNELQDPDRLAEKFERHGNIEHKLETYKNDGLQFIFQTIDWKKYGEFINDCNNHYEEFMKNSFQSDEERTTVLSNLDQAITRTERFQKTVEESVEELVAKHEEAVPEVIKNLRKHKGYNSLPEDVKDFIKIFWMFQASALNLESKHTDCKQRILEDRNTNKWKKLTIELKDHIDDFTENIGNKKRIHLLEETADYIISHDPHKNRDIISFMASYRERLDRWRYQLQEVINNPWFTKISFNQKYHLESLEPRDPPDYTTYTVHLNKRIHHYSMFIPIALKEILDKAD